MGEKTDMHVGGYHLTEVIGTGGMGTVFRATVEAEGKVLPGGAAVAVKILHPHLRTIPEFVKRFHREARLAAAIDHPNVVRVLEEGEEDRKHYIVMELVEGLRLTDLMGDKTPLSPQQTIEIARQTCEALAAAASIRDDGQTRTLVHRDIKPDNIIIQALDRKQLDTMTSTGDKKALANIHVKLLDFGLAKDVKALSTVLSQTGQSLGTPAYMSPEQCQGADVDQRSDIYSLGVCAYQMITGTAPFPGPTTVAYAKQHAEEIPPDILKRNPLCPRNLADCIYRCLAKDSADRYGSPVELKADLDRVAKGQGVAKVFRFKKKGSFGGKKVAAIAGAGVLAALLAVAGVSYFTTDSAKADLASAIQRAEVQIASQQYAGAKKTLEDAIAGVSGRPDMAELTAPAHKRLQEIAGRIAEQEQERNVAVMFNEASSALNAGKLDEARDKAQTALAGYPSNPRAAEFRRIRDEANRRIEQAIQEKAQRQKDADSELAKAQAKFDAADYKTAHQIASDALEKFPDTSVRDRLSALIEQSNENLAEQADLEKNAHTALANISSLVSERKWGQAVAAANEAVTAYVSAACAAGIRQVQQQAIDGKAESDRLFVKYRDEGDAAFGAATPNYSAAKIAYEKALAEHEDTDVRFRLGTCVERTTKQAVAVIDFEEKGDVKTVLNVPDAGQTVAELVLTRFGQERYQFVERSQLANLLKDADLTMALVRDSPEKIIGKLKDVKYLVLGRVSRLGSILVTARMVNATNGTVIQTAEVSAEDARGLQNALTELVSVLQMTDAEKKAHFEQAGFTQLLSDARVKASAKEFDAAITLYRLAQGIKWIQDVEVELTRLEIEKNPSLKLQPWRLETNPSGKEQYYLYVPSSYVRDRPTPVIAVCCLRKDFPSKMAGAWKRLAESSGMVVVVPTLDDLPSDGNALNASLAKEKQLIAIMGTLGETYNFDLSNMIICGFSDGGAAYWIGLRNPTVFSLIAAQSCEFDEGIIEGRYPTQAKSTKMLVFYNEYDANLIKQQQTAAIDYFRSHGFNISTVTIPGVIAGDFRPEVAMNFFRMNLKPPRPAQPFLVPVKKATAFPAANSSSGTNLDADSRPALSNAPVGSPLRRLLLDRLAQDGNASMLPDVVKAWAQETSDGANEQRFRAVVGKIAGQPWEQALLDGINSEPFLARGSAMTVLAGRTTATGLAGILASLTPRTEAMAALKASVTQLDYVPDGGAALLAVVSAHRLQPNSFPDAARLVRQWKGEGPYEFNIRDFHLLSRLTADPLRKPLKHDELAARVSVSLAARQHVTRPGVAEGAESFAKHAAELSMADLWNLQLLSEMLSEARVLASLRVMAQRDRADTRTEWGGLIVYNAGGAEARIYPPAKDSPADDLKYVPYQQMVAEGRDSVCRFLAHFEKAGNVARAGPTAAELRDAKEGNYYGMVLTTLGENEFCAHYFNPQGAVVSLGRFVFKS